MRKILSTVIVAAGLLWAGVAGAADEKWVSACARDSESVACSFELTGSPSAEDWDVPRGNEVFRMHLSGWDQMPAVYEIRRDPTGLMMLNIRASGYGSAIYIEADQMVWDAMLRRWATFKAEKKKEDAGAERAAAEDKRKGIEFVTIRDTHPCDASFEVVLNGKIERASYGCRDAGEAFKPIFYRAVPWCADIRESLDTCLKLEGDRYTAARVLTAFEAFRGGDCKMDVKGLIAPDPVLIQDGKTLRGAQAVEQFAAMRCQNDKLDFYPKLITGQRETVTVTGQAQQEQTDAIGRYVTYNYRYRLVWKKGDDGNYRIVSGEIGAPVLQKDKD